jgi:hypothetical protein
MNNLSIEALINIAEYNSIFVLIEDVADGLSSAGTDHCPLISFRAYIAVNQAFAC